MSSRNLNTVRHTVNRRMRPTPQRTARYQKQAHRLTLELAIQLYVYSTIINIYRYISFKWQPILRAAISFTVPFTTSPKERGGGERSRYKSNKLCTGSLCCQYKTPVREIKENLNKWREMPCVWTGRRNVPMMSIHSKLICELNKLPTIIPASFSVDTN